MKHIVGIDEAGRGPIAGPVAVGIAVIPVGFVEPEAFRDSKKLTEKRREAQYEALCEHPDIRFNVQMSDASYIDERGIVPAIRDAMCRGIEALNLDPHECFIKLDGALRAPSAFQQETVIKGDENVYAIALASIAAKVERDRHMVALGAKYPNYNFEKHKGYGTKAHYEAIAKHHICQEHRKSFLVKVLGE